MHTIVSNIRIPLKPAASRKEDIITMASKDLVGNKLFANSSTNASPAIIPEILRMYLNFGSRILTVPFRIKKSGCQEGYQCNYNGFFAKYTAMFLHVASTLHIGWSLVFLHWFVRKPRTTHSLIRGWVLFPTVVYTSIFVYHVWRRKASYLKIINHVQKLNLKLQALGMSPPSKFQVFLAVSFTMLHTILSTTLEVTVFNWNIYNGSVSGNVNRILFQGKGKYYEPLTSLWGSTSATVVVNAAAAILDIYGSLTTHYADQLCMAFVLTLFMLTNALSKFLKNPDATAVIHNEVILYINDLFELSDMIDEDHGVFVFGMCFSFLPYYSYMVTEVYNDAPGVRAQFVPYILTFTLAMLIAAETNSKMNGIKSWLRKVNMQKRLGHFDSCDRVYSDQVNILLHSVSNGGFGIKGKAFTITYGFVGGLVGLIITYAVISFQLQHQQ